MAEEMNWVDREEGNLFGIRKMADGGVVLVDSEGQEWEFPTLNAVAPLRAYPNQAKARFDIEIEPTALIPSVPTTKTAYVDGENGSDSEGQVGERTFPFLTIKAALTAAIIAGARLVLVYPGTYSEEPLTLAAGITLASVGGPESVTVQAAIATSPLVALSPSSVLKGFTLKGASGTGGVGASATSAGLHQVIECDFRDCETGLLASGEDVVVRGFRLNFSRISTETMVTAVKSAAKAFVSIWQIRIGGSIGFFIDNAMLVDGADSFGSLAVAGISLVNNGLRVANNASAVLTTGSVTASIVAAIRIDSSNGFARVTNVVIEQSVGEDILIEGSASRLGTSALELTKEPSIQAGSEWFGQWFDPVNRTVNVTGSFSVGSPAEPEAAWIGTGIAYTRGLKAFHHDGVGGWTDITEAVISDSGSEFNIVPGLGTGNEIYIGGDEPFAALQIETTLAQVGGVLLPTYWNGGAWQPYDWLTTEAVAPYAPSAKALFAAVGLQNMRHWPLPGWAMTTVQSESKYWIKKTVTSGLTTIPRAEQIKLISHCAKVNADGVIEFFGDARPEVYVDLDLNGWSGVSSPSNGTTSYSPNVTRGRLRADFPGTQTRDTGYRWPIPLGYDTSCIADLIVRWSPSNTNGGTMTLTKHHVVVPPNSLLTGTLPGEVSLAANETPSGTANLEQTITYPIAVPNAIAGIDSLAMTLIRDGVGDAFTGAVQVEKVTLCHRAWRL
jgi:hypothetical protein